MPKIKIPQDSPTWDALVAELGDPRTPVTFETTLNGEDVVGTSPTSSPTFVVTDNYPWFDPDEFTVEGELGALGER